MTYQDERSRRQGGFTLVELLVVLVILALLASLIAPRVTGYLGKARSGTARTQIEQLSTALELYNVDMGRYPTEQEGLEALVKAPAGGAQGWDGPYLGKAELPLDPWKREYRYRTSSTGIPYDIYTLGSDDAEGGEGDAADVRYSTLRTE
ncbi:type II secretion system major pseudopilin GspG [Parvularcula maris]|uniref:Type II secretion system core protein G n=1 Tax=Parvularcula maris TaxID=2965077 RepID=A0A9X2LB76_9PROT|nr:type II secretion system major pseudopilin GspG [Parvularcula maris]MCQ8186499.1 type II secretion system major pseudopilin GspG [Parvularcula maris]